MGMTKLRMDGHSGNDQIKNGKNLPLTSMVKPSRQQFRSQHLATEVRSIPSFEHPSDRTNFQHFTI